jgi:hypothetical protein
MRETMIENARLVPLKDNTLLVDLQYPRNPGQKFSTVEVNMTEVRACDSIRITYDFERDGWSIRQAPTFSWPADAPVFDSDWQEVAFVQAWAREIKPTWESE